MEIFDHTNSDKSPEAIASKVAFKETLIISVIMVILMLLSTYAGYQLGKIDCQ